MISPDKWVYKGRGPVLAGGFGLTKIPKARAVEISEARFAKEVVERFGMPLVGQVPEAIISNLEKEGSSRDDGGANILGIYNPSGGWKCMRLAYYEYHQVPTDKIKPSGLFRSGTIGELELERHIKSTYGRFVGNDYPALILVTDEGDSYGIEVPTPEDPNPVFHSIDNWTYKDKKVVLMIRGYSDFYLGGYNGKIRIMWEAKSVSRMGSKVSPNAHHLRQLALYWRASKAKSARMIYFERGDYGQIVEFEIPNEEMEAIFQEAVEWYIAFHEALLTGKVPPDKPIDENWECRYCGFVKRCKEDGGNPRL